MRQQIIYSLLWMLCFSGFNARADEWHESSSNGTQSICLTAPQMEEFLVATKQHLGQLKSLQADFIQKRYMQVFEEPLVAEGTLYYKAPDLLRWELIKPYPSVLLFVAGNVTKLVKDGDLNRELDMGSKEVMRRVIGMIIDWMQGDLEKSRAYFDIEVYREQDYLVRLIPKADEMKNMIRAIELTMDGTDYHVLQVNIEELRGDHIEIQYISEKWNLELSDALFTY